MTMNALPCVKKPAVRFTCLSALLCLLLLAFACTPKKGPDGTIEPNEKKMGYGLSVVLPTGWNIAERVGPEISNAALDSRRQNGERILLFDAVGPPSTKGFEPRFGIFLVNVEGTFLPAELAQKLRPDEFDSIAKEMLKVEHAAAKKRKVQSSVKDIQVSRDTIAGKTAILQKVMLIATNGVPVRLLNWDIYLTDSIGIAIKIASDPDEMGLEQQVSGIAKSLRISQDGK